jgi:adenylate cyclase
MTATRKLAAILAADVAGYSRLVGLDEEGTIGRLQALRRELIDPAISTRHGRIFKTTGDGMLVEFASVVDAVRCAVEVQRAMAERNGGIDADRRIEFRIGISVGDIVVDGADILGDGVNIAARLEGLAEPGGICVSARVQEDVHGKLDTAFEDAGEQNLKNISRQVRVYRLRLASAPPPALPLPDKPSIAVLPFTNMSGDAEQEYFSDGIAEDIITMLSHSRSLFVIARNSSFTYKGRAVDVKQVARELGVRYVLEGSVRRGGNRVRVTAQLIDAETGNHLWAERYDRDFADIFAVQDEITESVAIAIEPTVAEIERQRAVRRPPETIGAWEAYQRGNWHLSRTNANDHEKAIDYFRRAVDLDPNFAAAYAALAGATIAGATAYQKQSILDAVQEALPIAERAISLDPMDAVGHSQMALALTQRGDHDDGLAEVQRSLAISPNLALGHAICGVALLFSGRPRDAIEAVRRALKHDPYDPLRYMSMAHIATGHYLLREYDTAVEAWKETIRSYPDHPWAHYRLAAALGQLGRIDEAREALHKSMEIAPKAFQMYVHLRPPIWRLEDYEHMLDGLRKAGWAEQAMR